MPVKNTADALRAFKRVIAEGDLSLKLPVKVRFVAQDESLLSLARASNVCYIGASTQDNAREVFERFEPMRRLGGRLPWGKSFTLTRKEVEAFTPTPTIRFPGSESSSTRGRVCQRVASATVRLRIDLGAMQHVAWMLLASLGRRGSARGRKGSFA